MSLTDSSTNPEGAKAAFWIACMEAQVWEMKLCAATNDYEHYLKELADCAGVAIDAIRLFSGRDSFQVILGRFIENASKFTPEGLAKSGPRDTAFYLRKIAEIKAKLGIAE